MAGCARDEVFRTTSAVKRPLPVNAVQQCPRLIMCFSTDASERLQVLSPCTSPFVTTPSLTVRQD